MLYIKEGFPEVNELVYCTVTKVYGNTVFVNLDEYDKEGVLTISEIKQGRIRNIRDHVAEGRKIVCKVIKVIPNQNRIEVSLRRVSITMRNEKLEEIKKEEFSEKVYEHLAKEFGITKEELFEKTYEPIFEEFGTVFEALYAIMQDEKKIEMFSNLTDKEKKIMLDYIIEKIKPEQVILKKKINIYSYESNGIEIVKETIKNSLDGLDKEKIKVVYIAAGKYEIIIKDDDMKSADIIKKTFIENLKKKVDNKKIIFEE